jgi:hypothetical protein
VFSKCSVKLKHSHEADFTSRDHLPIRAQQARGSFDFDQVGNGKYGK